MSWIKEVLVDIVVTVFIIAALVMDATWMHWVVVGYTGVLVLAKILVLAGDDALQLIRKTQGEAPDWFPQLLYAINAGALLYFRQWYLAAGWLLIWLLSYRALRKFRGKKGGKKQ